MYGLHPFIVLSLYIMFVMENWDLWNKFSTPNLYHYLNIYDILSLRTTIFCNNASLSSAVNWLFIIFFSNQLIINGVPSVVYFPDCSLAVVYAVDKYCSRWMLLETCLYLQLNRHLVGYYLQSNDRTQRHSPTIILLTSKPTTEPLMNIKISGNRTLIFPAAGRSTSY